MGRHQMFLRSRLSHTVSGQAWRDEAFWGFDKRGPIGHAHWVASAGYAARHSAPVMVQMNEGKTRVGKFRNELHERVFKIIIDNAAKKNAFSPQMMAQMSDALTILHTTEAYWVGVVCAEGNDFTAGLDMEGHNGCVWLSLAGISRSSFCCRASSKNATSPAR